MSQRIFILGGGRFGMHLASRLCEVGCEVIVADSDTELVKDLSADGFHAVELDAEDELALKEAGVTEADAVVVCIGDNMEGSILSTLALKELKVKKIIARALDDKHAQVLERLGADLVVLPSRDMAERLAERIRANSLHERMPLSGEYQLAQVRVGKQLHGQTLAEAKLPQTYKVNVVLITRGANGEDTKDFEPSADFSLKLSDVLMVVGQRENINRFEKDCGASA